MLWVLVADTFSELKHSLPLSFSFLDAVSRQKVFIKEFVDVQGLIYK
jgi:hypothetical protein